MLFNPTTVQRITRCGLIAFLLILVLLVGGGTLNQSPAAQETPTITSSSLEHIDGTTPAMENITLHAAFQNEKILILSVRFDSEDHTSHELARAGADRSTTFRVSVTVEGYIPRNLRATGQDLSWTRSFRGDGTVKMTITGKPVQVQRAAGTYRMDDWDGTIHADRVVGSKFTLRTRSFESHATSLRERINGTIIATDASSVGTPALRRDSQGRKQLELLVGAPHYTVDGEVHTGVYEAVLAQPLLTAWNITSPDQLDAWYNGNATDFSATQLDDGSIRVTMTPQYSAADVAVGQQQSDLALPFLVAWKLIFLYTKYTSIGITVILVSGGILFLNRRR